MTGRANSADTVMTYGLVRLVFAAQGPLPSELGEDFAEIMMIVTQIFFVTILALVLATPWGVIQITATLAAGTSGPQNLPSDGIGRRRLGLDGSGAGDS